MLVAITAFSLSDPQPPQRISRFSKNGQNLQSGISDAHSKTLPFVTFTSVFCLLFSSLPGIQALNHGEGREEVVVIGITYSDDMLKCSRPSGGGKPLHWTSCLKIAEDLATGLVYLHQTAGIVHGNLKSSNVLLGSDFESCLTDYGLTPFRSPDSLEDSGGSGSSASALFYRAPECRHPRKPFTEQSDVYSFGVLLLEVLTGKTPFQDLVQEHGADIPNWVRSVREEETESGEDPSSGNEASEEKLSALLNIAVACVASVAENRPAMKDVFRMIKEARAEAQVSSNSSDHSPGRWSDTVQSLPREYGAEHLNFTERD
ncbi:hypothetical protein ACLOJK_017225 [Asimina triloba]